MKVLVELSSALKTMVAELWQHYVMEDVKRKHLVLELDKSEYLITHNIRIIFYLFKSLSLL